MRAVVLAGGSGTRLRPYTRVLPKPLLPIGDRPILEIIVGQLRAAGIIDIVIATGYLSSLIQTYFGDGSAHGVRIAYTHEERALGTVGPLTLVEGLEDTFLLMNGDVLTDLSYPELMRSHRSSGAHVTIAVRNQSVELDYGIVELNGGVGELRRIAAIREKPRHVYPVSMGVYAFEPEVLQHLEQGRHADLPDLIDRLLHAGGKVAAYEHDGYWADVGQAHSLDAAVEEFELRAERFVQDPDSRPSQPVERVHKL